MGGHFLWPSRGEDHRNHFLPSMTCNKRKKRPMDVSASRHLHSWKLTSGMKPISFRWLLSSGSWKAIIWEKTVKYSETQVWA